MKNINSLSSYVLHQFIKYSSNNENCQCYPDYCRCSTIDIEGIDKDISGCVSISELGETDLEKALLFMYAKDLLTLEDIEANAVSGYYGQELEVSGFSNTGLEDLYTFNNFTDIEKLTACLNAENIKRKFKTKVLEDFTSIKFDKIHRKLISPLANNNLCSKSLNLYSDYYLYNNHKDLPVICVLRKTGNDSYRIIDGRHRFAIFTDKFPKKLIPAIVVE